jgi:hypothetical protein
MRLNLPNYLRLRRSPDERFAWNPKTEFEGFEHLGSLLLLDVSAVGYDEVEVLIG